MVNTNDTVIRVAAELDMFGGKAAKKLKKAASTMEKDIFTALDKAVGAAFSTRQMRNLEKKMLGVSDTLKQAYIEAADIGVKLAEKGIGQEEKKRLQAAMKVARARLGEQEKLARAELKATEQVAARRKKLIGSAEKAGRLEKGGGRAEAVGEEIASAFSDVLSGDMKQMAGLIKKMGTHSKKAAAVAAKQDAGGPLGQAASGLSKFLGKVGPALIAIGSLVAGIAAVGAVLIQADSAAKELNKQLLDSGVAGADLAGRFGLVEYNINRVRKAFTTAFDFNRIWGTEAKDHIVLLGAYAEAGVTFKKLTGHIKDSAAQMQRLRDATGAAVAYSKLLGMSQQEVATNMATYMEELGYTLAGVKEEFSNLMYAARDSGFSTKRFVAIMLQATSGMSMYNVRLSETAGLLIDLGKILGQKLGGDFLSTLTQGFKGESRSEAIKKVKQAGQGYHLDVLQKGAEKTVGKLKDKLADFAKEEPKKFAAITEQLGINIDKMTDKDIARKFAKLDAKTRARVLAEVGAIAGTKDAGLVRMIEATIDKSLAFRGGLSGAAAARGMADPAEVLMLKMNEMRSLVGPLYELDWGSANEAIMTWEKETGQSGEELRKLWKIGQHYYGDHQKLLDEQRKIDKIRKKEGEEAAERAAKRFNDTVGKEMGVALDAQGRRFVAVVEDGQVVLGDKLENTWEGVVRAQGAELEEAMKPRVEEDLALARQVAAATKEATHVLKAGVQKLLEGIYGKVGWIASFFGAKGLNPEQQEARAESIAAQEEQIAAYRKELMEQESLIQEGQAKLGQGGTTEKEKLAIQAELKERVALAEKLRAGIEVRQGMVKRTAGVRTAAAAKRGGGDPLDPATYARAALDGGGARELLQGVVSQAEFKTIEAVAKAAQESAWQKLVSEGKVPSTLKAPQDEIKYTEARRASALAASEVYAEQLHKRTGVATGGAKAGITGLVSAMLGTATGELGSTQTHPETLLEDITGSLHSTHAKEAKAAKEREKREKYLAEKGVNKNQAKEQAKAQIDAQKKAARERAVEALKGARGVSESVAQGLVGTLESGGKLSESQESHLTGPVAQALLTQPDLFGASYGMLQQRAYGGAAPRVGPDAGPPGAGGGPGGKGGKGGNTIVNHFYHDAKGLFNSLNRMVEAVR